MDQKERTAIAATLDDSTLLARVARVAGGNIGDPLNNNLDSVTLRVQFGLTVEYNHSSVWAFNDDVRACWRTYFPDSAESARRATVIAVASMWRPQIEKTKGTK